jgi:CBS domain-containing protein
MLGAGLGAVLSHVLPGGEPALWPLACMAAMLGATLGAPLTAIVFAFGVTHDTNAMLPVLATTLTAYGFVTFAMRRSIMTEKIARRGRHVYREYGVDPLERNHVEDVMTTEVEAIDAQLAVREVLTRYFGSAQRFRAYPVAGNGGVVLGIVDRALFEDARASHGEALDEMLLADIMPSYPISFALPQETCRVVATRLAIHQAERLAVVDSLDTRRLVGIVTRSDLIEPARAHHDEEHRLERMFGHPSGVPSDTGKTGGTLSGSTTS